VRNDLRRCFSGFGAFNFELRAIRRFGDEVLYLGLEPAEPFRQLTRAAHEYSPDTPPHSGRFVNSVPHLTVAQRHAGTLLDEIALKLQSAAAGKLPIRTRANEVVLMDTCMEGWEISERLPLAP
jgi:2'-5' RNA ligase superfamily